MADKPKLNTGLYSLHRDEKLTPTMWETFCHGMSEKKRGHLANLIAHGWRATRLITGEIRLDRNDQVRRLGEDYSTDKDMPDSWGRLTGDKR